MVDIALSEECNQLFQSHFDDIVGVGGQLTGNGDEKPLADFLSRYFRSASQSGYTLDLCSLCHRDLNHRARGFEEVDIKSQQELRRRQERR